MRKWLISIMLFFPVLSWGVAGNIDDNESGAAVNVSDTALLIVSGDFGTGTATLEILVVDELTTKWIAVTNGAFTADATQLIQLGAPANMRVTVSGATSPDLDWEIRQ